MSRLASKAKALYHPDLGPILDCEIRWVSGSPGALALDTENLRMPRGGTELDRDGAISVAVVAPPPAAGCGEYDEHPVEAERRRLSEPPFAFPSPTVTLVLVGGQRLLRDATASLLAAQDGLTVLGTFESAAHFLAAGMEHPPAMLLLDCDGGDPCDLRSAVRVLSSAQVESRIVLLCKEIREEVVRCAIEHGVGGVILKSYSTKDIRAAISYMATGRTVMPGGWQRAGVSRARERLGLSPRHREILVLIAQGRCNEEIAIELDLSSNTIKFHIRALYSRLGVRNRVEAARQYAQMTSGSD
jgi:DNA-binding NarL/FixJ family response regulator